MALSLSIGTNKMKLKDVNVRPARKEEVTFN